MRPNGPRGNAPGWYRAHADPVVGHALRLIHHNPGHPWTLAELSGEVGISRAALSVGCDPGRCAGHRVGMSELERRRQLEALLVAHAAAVRAYAARRIPAGDVDDVTSEVFVVAWRRLDDVPDDALPWLLGCARRIIANRLRGTQRQTALRHRLGLERPTPSGVSIPDSGLATALGTLSAADREALMLVGWDGLDHTRAAAAAGCSPRAFSMRVHRARRRLAAALAREDATCLDPMEATR